MKLPAFITPNFITVMRLLFVPVGAYTLFKNGGDDPTCNIFRGVFSLFLDYQTFWMES